MDSKDLTPPAASGSPCDQRKVISRRFRDRDPVPKDAPPPGEPRNIGYLYIAPALILYAVFVLAPFVHSVYLSFFSWDGLGSMKFVGLLNFIDIVSNKQLRSSFANAAVLIFFYSILTTFLALVAVGVITRGRVRGLSVIRTILFLPYVIAPTATAVIWRWVLAPDGPLNETLTLVGLESLRRPWLGDFTFALPAVGLVGTWVLFGVALALLMAGVQKIPSELYDAARVDGASAVREFLAVTLPGLRAELSVVLVLTTTAALRSFDVIYVLTQGGPGDTTSVPSWLVYSEAFIAGRVGTAAAVGLVLLIVIVVANVAITRLGRV